MFMVLRFTGEISKGAADEFNAKLNDLLKALNRAAAGGPGFGKVIASNASSVNVKP